MMKHTIKRFFFGAALVLALSAGLMIAPTLAQPDGDAPFLGIFFSAESTDGVVIERVMPNSPAAEAGLASGDVIVEIEGEAVTTESIREALAGYNAGDEVTLTVERGEDTLDIAVTLGEFEGRGGRFMFSMPRAYVGISLGESDAGVTVENVQPDSPAAEAGLASGDVITTVNGEAVASPDDVVEIVRTAEPGDTLSLEVTRGDDTLSLDITLAELPPMRGFGGDHGRGPGRHGERDGFGFGGRMPFGMMMPMGGQLGVQFETIDEAIAEANNLDVTEGALITEVVADSPAAEAGLQADDVVTAVDGDVVDAERTLRDRLFAYEPGDTVTLTVVRAGESLDLEVTLAEMAFPHDMFEGMPFNGFNLPFDEFEFEFVPPMRGEPGAPLL